LPELRERLRPAQDAAERQQIRAPIAGEVVNLKITSPGAVIGPREPLLDIVPHDAFLLDRRALTRSTRLSSLGRPCRSYFSFGAIPCEVICIQQLEDEVAMARIWGGVYYRTSNEAGNALGQKGAIYIAEHYLRPIR
jgi:hypothetical protein